MNLSQKRKEFLKKFFGNSEERILSCMSSAYCEGDKEAFKDDFGLSVKEGTEAVKAFIYHIQHL